MNARQSANYEKYCRSAEEATEILSVVCSVVFEKYPHWRNKRKALSYAKLHGLISEEEYEIVVQSRII